LLLSRSRSKLEDGQPVPPAGKFMDAEQICLLNGAAAFLERKLFRQALENSDMVRAVISCVMPVIGLALKYVVLRIVVLVLQYNETFNLKLIDVSCIVPYHCE
jgi:hypothetical protein